MSEPQNSFLALVLAGDVPLGEIDEYVDRWHDNPGNRTLHDYLGLSRDEYALWLAMPDALPLVLMSRELNRPIESIVHEELQSRQAADTSTSASRLRRLEIWFKRHVAAE